MDFLRRNANDQPQATRPAGTQATSSSTVAKQHNITKHEPRWLRITFVVLLFSITILALAIAMLLYFGKDKEGHYVDTSKYQAVFLTNGQVYFGHIGGINDKVVNLQNIYYLNSQQQPATDNKSTTNAQTSFSLVKLGCELHGPSDQMVINRDQVSFWENLTSSGKVAKAIDQFQSQNPNGQTCSDNNSQNTTDQSQSTSTNSSTTNNSTTKKQ
jgi:hypothetical protein